MGDTEAPTGKNTLAKVDERLNKLSELDTDIVMIVVKHYHEFGTLMTAALAFEHYQIPPTEFSQSLGSEPVQAAIAEWGIEIGELLKRQQEPDNEGWKSSGLTPLQLLAATTFLNLDDRRSDQKKLKDLGIKPAQWQAWLRDPVFSDYLRRVSEAQLQGSHHEASLALMDKVRSGDLGGIKLFLEYTGRFVAKADSGGAGSLGDFQSLLTNVIEIITDEVDDYDTAIRISERLKRLISTRNTATALIGNEDPIVVPEVMPAREISPHMQELMDHGVGVND